MKISIIIPMHNSASFITELLISILRQPIKTEIILINDGSNDNTYEICNHFILSNTLNCKQFNLPQNMGAGAARNIGIDNATGDYIIFCDSDDYFLPNAINESLISFLDDWKKKEIDIIYTTRSSIGMDKKGNFKVTNPEKRIKNNMPKLEFWTCIYRTRFLKSNNIRFFEFKEQDIETAFRFKAFSATKKIIITPKLKLIAHRNNPLSNTHNFNYHNLYLIKGYVYIRLKDETPNITNLNKIYLHKIFLSCMKDLNKVLLFKHNEYFSLSPISKDKLNPFFLSKAFFVEINQMYSLKDLLSSLGIKSTIDFIFQRKYLQNNWLNIKTQLSKYLTANR